jgi:hypothetical protein
MLQTCAEAERPTKQSYPKRHTLLDKIILVNAGLLRRFFATLAPARFAKQIVQV